MKRSLPRGRARALVDALRGGAPPPPLPPPPDQEAWEGERTARETHWWQSEPCRAGVSICPWPDHGLVWVSPTVDSKTVGHPLLARLPPLPGPPLPGPSLDEAARQAARAACAITGEHWRDVLAKGRMRWQLTHDGTGY